MKSEPNSLCVIDFNSMERDLRSTLIFIFNFLFFFCDTSEFAIIFRWDSLSRGFYAFNKAVNVLREIVRTSMLGILISV